MTSVSFRLEGIARALENASGGDRVLIHSSCMVQNSLWSWLPGVFSCLLPLAFKQENRETVNHFFAVFGQRRVFEISKRYGLDLEEKYSRGLSLTKKDVNCLFLGSADVRREDVQALFEEMKTGSAPYIANILGGESIQSRFKDKHSVQDLSKEDLDEMYRVLVPFERIETIFLNHIPNITPLSPRDDSLTGRINRVFLIEEMRRNRSLDEASWQIRLSKRLVDEDLQKGVIIPHPQGYYEHQALVQGGGAYKLLLRPLNYDTDLKPIISYLSTRFTGRTFDSLLSRMESLRQNIGENGVEATYKETESYLTDVSKGFVRSAHEKVWLIGMSLGGAQASRDACLFKDRVAKLTSICAPGIDEKTARWFAEQDFKEPMHIHHMVEKDDVVPDLGQAHLGMYCDPKCVKVLHTTFLPSYPGCKPFNPIDAHARPQAPETIRSMFYDLFINSMIYTHSRETTAQMYHSITLSNEIEEQRRKIDAILHNANDPLRRIWEDIRQTIARGEGQAFFSFLRKRA